MIKPLLILSAIVVFDSAADGYLRMFPIWIIILCYLLSAIDVIVLPKMAAKIIKLSNMSGKTP